MQTRHGLWARTFLRVDIRAEARHALARSCQVADSTWAVIDTRLTATPEVQFIVRSATLGFEFGARLRILRGCPNR
jgi:hypothetical protein